jgi:DNA-binding transcriptional LysR family regulator
MAKAAKDLALTQPAVSKAIAEMEHTLGVRLLDRTSRGVEPTPYGRALLKWGGVIVDDLHQAVKEVEFLADPTAGELRIGAHEPMLMGLLPVVLDRLSRQFPRIAFHVVPGRTAFEQYRDLRERRLDLIIGRVVRFEKEEDLNTEILFNESLHVVAGTQNRWVRRRSVQLAELANEPWILPGQAGVVWPAITEAFRANGVDIPRTGVISYSIPLHTAMVSTGRFLAMLPRSLIWFGGKRLGMKALPIELPEPPPVGITTLENRTISPVARLFIDCARAVAKPLANRS